MFEIGPEFLISVQTGYFSGFPEPWLWVLIQSASLLMSSHMFLWKNKKNINIFEKKKKSTLSRAMYHNIKSKK